MTTVTQLAVKSLLVGLLTIVPGLRCDAGAAGVDVPATSGKCCQESAPRPSCPADSPSRYCCQELGIAAQPSERPENNLQVHCSFLPARMPHATTDAMGLRVLLYTPYISDGHSYQQRFCVWRC